MMQAIFYSLMLFAGKLFIFLIFICLLLISIIAIVAANRPAKSKLKVNFLNRSMFETESQWLKSYADKKTLKKWLTSHKEHQEYIHNRPNTFVLSFNGDMQASQTAMLSQQISHLLNIANPHDEVVLKLESAGGVVHGYGLAAAELQRLKEKNLQLTITVDKVAASGGYMMACVADQLIAAPFAIIGSIGVVVQLPNFHRVLKDKHIDYEMHTAGDFKRTLTVFGENTPEGRHKLQEEIEVIHTHFKRWIHSHRPMVDIDQVATGEHWIAEDAYRYGLVDKLSTSDQYLHNKLASSNVIEIKQESKKSRLQQLLRGQILGKLFSFLENKSLYK